MRSLPVNELRLCTIASGSSGNCVFAEHSGGAILIDAGISGKKIAEGLKHIGRNPSCLRGIFVTHDHTDHVNAAGIMARRYNLPLLMSRGTLEGSRHKLGKVARVECFRAGDKFSYEGFEIETIPTPHDGVEPVALVLNRGKTRAGVLTDLGHKFDALREVLATLDGAVLESNYDPVMLKNGPYPAYLQNRIRSDAGHISNEEAAQLVQEHASARLKVVLLAHLSQNNNTPDIAMKTFYAKAEEFLKGEGVKVSVAPRHEPSPMMRLRFG